MEIQRLRWINQCCTPLFALILNFELWWWGEVVLAPVPHFYKAHFARIIIWCVVLLQNFIISSLVLIFVAISTVIVCACSFAATVKPLACLSSNFQLLSATNHYQDWAKWVSHTKALSVGKSIISVLPLFWRHGLVRQSEILNTAGICVHSIEQ